MKKNLTPRYALHHIAHWAAAAGTISFATTYLLYKGFAPSKVGTLMACGTILSCITQPVLASVADKARKTILPTLIACLSLVGTVCFGLLLTELPDGLFPYLYLVGIWSFDAMLPLLNSVSVYYNRRGYTVNFGLSRGLGSLSYAISALVMGRVMEAWGADWMIRIVLVLLPVIILLTMSYPRLQPDSATLSEGRAEPSATPCTIGQFFMRYRWYCASLAGIAFLSMFHTMAENYLIAIMGRLGGDSSNVGVALSVATVGESLVMFSMGRIRRRIRDSQLLKIAACGYLLKSILFVIAPSIHFIYAAQLLQTVTYALLAPVMVFHAGSRVRPEDMVKGQAFANAFYSLGAAGGNFFGGQLMEWLGVSGILGAGVIMAATGLIVLIITVERKDAYLTEIKGAAI